MLHKYLEFLRILIFRTSRNHILYPLFAGDLLHRYFKNLTRKRGVRSAIRAPSADRSMSPRPLPQMTSC